jgi:type I restriction enzyme S subunit
MSFPRYPTYKPSGVEWLGEVPEHWEVLPLKREFDVVGGSTPKSDMQDYWDGDIQWITPADLSRLQSFEITESIRTITAEGLNSCGTTMVPSGSVVVSTRAPIGSLGIAGIDLCTNQGCKALVPIDQISSRFTAYFLGIASEALNVRGRGATFLEISGDELGAFKATFPPCQEQVQIATFLDHETAKIDALIAEQQRLIELLQEKRQAVISQAVTKGLNPDAPMKDSGVEWLGEVPEHWTVMPLRLAARIESGHTPSRSHEEYWIEKDCVYPWFTLGDVWQIRDGKAEYVFETQEKVSQVGLDNSAARMLPANTVILSRTASVGFSGILGVPMATTQDFVNWVCGPKIAPEFLLFVFRAMSKEFERLKYGSTHNTIYMPDIFSFRVALPSLIEQGEIVSDVRESLRRLDGSFDDLLSSKELLKERRSALISAAVTGQIDVRGLVTEACAA